MRNDRDHARARRWRAGSLLLRLTPALLLLAGAPAARGQALPLGGRLLSYVRAPLDDTIDSPLQQVSTAAWLEARPRLSGELSGRIGLVGELHEARPVPGPASSVAVREAWVRYRSGGWEARVGRQILPWGNADLFSPADVLTARDSTTFAVQDEDRRLGSISALLSYTPAGGTSPLTFTLLGAPVAPVSQPLLPPELIPANVDDQGDLPLERSLANSEAAARIGYAGLGWDASLFGFVGWSHTPHYTLLAVDGATVRVARTLHPVTVVGGYASAGAGAWVFRLESAFSSTARADERPPLVPPSSWDSVLGVERPLGDRFRVQAQLLLRTFADHVSPDEATGPDPLRAEVSRRIAETNALLHNYQERTLPAGTLRLAYASEDNELELEAVGGLASAGWDYFVRALVRYRWVDPFHTVLGVEVFGGPQDRPLGALHDYSGAFVEAGYAF